MLQAYHTDDESIKPERGNHAIPSTITSATCYGATGMLLLKKQGRAPAK